MHYLRNVILAACFLPLTAFAQATSEDEPSLRGSGNPGSIPQWIGPHKLGNSVIIQAGNRVGVGNPNPYATLDVSSSGPTALSGITSSTGLYANGVFGESASPTGSGISGESTAASGGNGVYGHAASPAGVGVSGSNTDPTGGTGVYGQTASAGYGAGVSGAAIANSGNAVGVFGSSNSPNGIAISGAANASTGQSFGVLGSTFSDEGVGVIGNRPNPGASGFGGGGVRGLTSAGNFVFTYGVAGVATAPTGGAVAMFGEAWSNQGIAGLFINRQSGEILRGSVGQYPDITVFRVDGSGRVYANGGFQPSGADFAESMEASGDRAGYAAGDLLVIDSTSSRRVALAQQPYSTLVAGIYSTKPGLLGTTRRVDEPESQSEIPLAVVGIVPCKVTAANGAIKVGDLLVTSAVPGHAMRGVDRGRMLGAVVGKALEPLPAGQGVIQVLVTLQ